MISRTRRIVTMTVGLSVVVAFSGLVFFHVRNEKVVEVEIERLGGRVEWEHCCVRYVSFEKINDDQLVLVTKELAKLRWLKSLSLSHTEITDKGVKSLSELSSLVWLYLGHTCVTDKGLVSLENLNNLEYLDLIETKVSDDGIKNLRKALPNLKKIQLTLFE